MRKLASLAMVVWLGACGSSSDGVSLDNFPDVANQNYCENATQCGFYPDVQTCLDTQVINDVAQPQADAEAGLLNPDENALAICASVTQGCNRQFNTTQTDVDRIQACIDSVRGTLPDGEACTAATQCEGGVCQRPDTCDPMDTCCQGVCATGELPFAGNGESCATTFCDVGLYCAIESDGMNNFALNCRPQIQSGQPCPQAGSCADGLWCNSADGQSVGSCQALAGPGETCDGTSATRNYGCSDVTTYCETSTNVCEDRPDLGEACSDSIPCIGYAYCNAGTCDPRPLEGEACNNDLGMRCLGDLACTNNVCAFPAPNDAPICTL